MSASLTHAFGARTRLKSRWIWAGVLTVILVALAAGAASAENVGGVPLFFALLALAIFLAPYLAFTTTSFARDLGWWLRRRPQGLLQVGLFFVGTYLIYAAGTQSFAWPALAKVMAFVGVPILLTLPSLRRATVTWWDFLVVAAIWLPFDFGLLEDVWTWPAGGAAYVMNTAMAIDLAVVLFVSVRGVSGVPLRFRLSLREFGFVIAALAGFLILAVPFGFSTGFIRFNPQAITVKALLAPIGIFFFIAVPEELLFRGLVQNFLAKKTGKPVVALGLAAVIFGATHLNNGDYPDWRYFVLASIAGFFYGLTYMKSKSLLAPALVHALVDSLWVTFFHT